MSARRHVIRFYYQHAIYLPRPQSLAIVLGVFKLNYQVKRDKGGNGKERKKKRVFSFPSFVKNLKKAYTRGSAMFHVFQNGQGRLCSEYNVKSYYYYTMVTIL